MEERSGSPFPPIVIPLRCLSFLKKCCFSPLPPAWHGGQVFGDEEGRWRRDVQRDGGAGLTPNTVRRCRPAKADVEGATCERSPNIYVTKMLWLCGLWCSQGSTQHMNPWRNILTCEIIICCNNPCIAALTDLQLLPLHACRGMARAGRHRVHVCHFLGVTNPKTQSLCQPTGTQSLWQPTGTQSLDPTWPYIWGGKKTFWF